MNERIKQLAEQAGFRHVCNLWVDPISSDYVVDHCDHPPRECVPAYIVIKTNLKENNND